MRILLTTLILTYNIYFGYVIREIIISPKRYTVKALAISLSKNDVIIWATDLNHQLKRSNERSRYLDIYSRCHSTQKFSANKPQIISMNSILRRCNYKIVKRHSCPCFHDTVSKVYQRKLLGYDHKFSKQPTRNYKDQRIYRNITRKKGSKVGTRNVIAKEIESNDKNADSEKWDAWNNWSACSVTCGRGRQVRWRHCLSENCVKGLKKAQMKSCHLKECETKGFLKWLGIKSRSV